MTQSELHNELAGKIVAAIVKPPLEAGGGWPDVMVLLESVVLGVMLYGHAQMKNFDDDVALDLLRKGVKHRLAEQRGTRQ
jgi:hypothetical protein